MTEPKSWDLTPAGKMAAIKEAVAAKKEQLHKEKVEQVHRAQAEGLDLAYLTLTEAGNDPVEAMRLLDKRVVADRLTMAQEHAYSLLRLE